MSPIVGPGYDTRLGNLLLWYSFEEGTGFEIPDRSDHPENRGVVYAPSERHTTDHAAGAYAISLNGVALHSGGPDGPHVTTDYVQTHSGLPTPNVYASSMVVSAWVKVDWTNHNQTVIETCGNLASEHAVLSVGRSTIGFTSPITAYTAPGTFRTLPGSGSI